MQIPVISLRDWHTPQGYGYSIGVDLHLVGILWVNRLRKSFNAKSFSEYKAGLEKPLMSPYTTKA